MKKIYSILILIPIISLFLLKFFYLSGLIGGIIWLFYMILVLKHYNWKNNLLIFSIILLFIFIPILFWPIGLFITLFFGWRGAP
jgi:hypothetical protein